MKHNSTIFSTVVRQLCQPYLNTTGTLCGSQFEGKNLLKQSWQTCQSRFIYKLNMSSYMFANDLGNHLLTEASLFTFFLFQTCSCSPQKPKMPLYQENKQPEFRTKERRDEVSAKDRAQKRGGRGDRSLSGHAAWLSIWFGWSFKRSSADKLIASDRLLFSASSANQLKH